MKRVSLVLALLGALFAGWLPVMAATANICAVTMPAAGAMHHGDHAGDPSPESEKKPLHPVACAACFALPALGTGPVGRLSPSGPLLPEPVQPLSGLAAIPLDPPPRA